MTGIAGVVREHHWDLGSEQEGACNPHRLRDPPTCHKPARVSEPRTCRSVGGLLIQGSAFLQAPRIQSGMQTAPCLHFSSVATAIRTSNP